MITLKLMELHEDEGYSKEVAEISKNGLRVEFKKNLKDFCEPYLRLLGENPEVLSITIKADSLIEVFDDTDEVELRIELSKSDYNIRGYFILNNDMFIVEHLFEPYPWE